MMNHEFGCPSPLCLPAKKLNMITDKMGRNVQHLVSFGCHHACCLIATAQTYRPVHYIKIIRISFSLYY